MGIGGIWQWVVVLVIILLIFGTKKLRNLGSDLGHAVKDFRKGVSAGKNADKDDTVTEQPVAEPEAVAAASVSAPDAVNVTSADKEVK